MTPAPRMKGTLATARRTLALAAVGSLALHGAVLAGVLWLREDATAPAAPPMRVIAMIAVSADQATPGPARERRADAKPRARAAAQTSPQAPTRSRAKTPRPPKAQAEAASAQAHAEEARTDSPPALVRSHARADSPPPSEDTRTMAPKPATPKAPREAPPRAVSRAADARPTPVAMTAPAGFARLFPPPRPKPRTPDPRAAGPVAFKAAVPAAQLPPQPAEARDETSRGRGGVSGPVTETEARMESTASVETGPSRRGTSHPTASSVGDADKNRQEAAVAGQVATAPATPPRTPPGPGLAGLANPAPVYPWLARRRGEQGRVVLRVSVGTDGRPIAVAVRRSSGHARLDAAALRAVRRWRFRPARRAWRAVAGTIDVPISFRLTD